MNSERRRALSFAQAQRCEDALHPRCRCRCGGALHGAKRGSVLELALTDPHALSQICRHCEGRGIAALGLTCPTCGGEGRIGPPRAIAAALAIAATQ